MQINNQNWKFWQKWSSIKVKEIMSKDIRHVKAEICVRDVASLFRDEITGCVPVKENGKVIGIITDRDITCRVTAEDRDPATVTAKEIMTGDVSCCFEDDLLCDAAEVMEKKRIRRLPVLDRDEELVGLLTADVLARNADYTLFGKVMERVQVACR
jgi:CBS domain-containing protein